MCKICWTNNCNCPKPNIIPLCWDWCTSCSTPCGWGKVVSSRYWSCWDCKDNCNNVANIIAWKHIKIKAFDNNCGKDVEVEAERPKVASDWTMSVQLWTMNGTAFTPNPEWDTWYLRVTCCTDKLVWVSPTDTPWYLQNKIRLCTSLTSAWWSLLPQEVTPWNYVMELCAPITNTDEKVAAAAWCPPKYLSDILNTNYGDYFSFQQIGCNVRLSIQPRCLLHEDIWTTSEYTATLQDDSIWYVTIPSSYYNRTLFATPVSICPSSLVTISAATLAALYPWGWTVWNNAIPWVQHSFTDTTAVKTLNAGKYILESSSTISTGQWVATLRWFIAILYPTGENYLVWETAFEWPRYYDVDTDNEINSAGDLIAYADWINPPTDWSQMQWSITRSIPRTSYNSWRVVYLPAWALIYKIRKYSTNTAEIDAKDDLKLEFKKSGSAWTLSDESGGWCYLSVAEIPFKRISE